ncbi:hypothetical protein JEQ12_017183 [Ovis aries]|uniref:Secreted protein n=1 Tax=Ovis aries TaxID=9940 RepID=A0A836AFA2_SHEEP|nr:hypothetical protein JEQ12_017183 [Ovis aries]
MSSILTCSLKVCFLFCPIRIITAAVSYFIPSNGDKYTAYKNLNYERIYNKRSAVRPRERSGWLCDFSPGTVISLFSYLWKGTCSGCRRSFSVLEIRVEVDSSSSDNHLKGDDPPRRRCATISTSLFTIG